MCKILNMLGCLLLLVSWTVIAADNEFEVKVAIEGPRYTRTLAEELAVKAKTEALKKYLLRLDANMGADLIRKACAEADLFVEGIEEKQVGKWTNITKDAGQLEGRYVVELKLEEINQWLKVNGHSTQGKIEIVIMEEPPSIASIKLTAEAGTATGNVKSFVQNYTSFQRRVRDCLIKKVDEFGFDVKLLADNDLYTEFRDKDDVLVGVFFDPETNNFVINRNLLKAVQSNNPDTLVLYYRLETLEHETTTGQLRVTITLNIKNLDSNVTKSFGSETFVILSQASTTALLIDDIGLTAERAIMKLMNANGAASRLNKLAMEFKNTTNAPAGPVKVTINASIIDAKIRKKIMYQLKKQLIANKVTTKEKIKSNNTSMTFEAAPEFQDPEELYMEKILPLFEELGIEVDDDKIFCGKGTLTIKP